MQTCSCSQDRSSPPAALAIALAAGGPSSFASNRNPANGQDIWVATREDVSDPWSALVNIGPAVNITGNETRPSLSWDGTTLYFGRAPLGSVADIFVTTRDRIPG